MRNTRHRPLKLNAVLQSVLFTASLFASPAFADTQFDLDLPAQEMETALKILEQQAGVHLLYSPEVVKGRQTHGVSGHLSASDALQRMLAGSGLRIVAMESGIAITDTAAATEAMLGDVNVTGKKIDDYTLPVTISGTRTATPIEQIPQSVITVPSKVMEDQGARSVSDVLRNVSNVNSVDSRDSNNVGFRVRGFGAAAIVDGVAMPGYFPNLESLVNVERIDVVKGPAGNLFGSSQNVGTSTVSGGMINLTTRLPESTPVKKVSANVGSYGEKGVSFDLSQPLSEVLAIRLAGEQQGAKSETDRFSSKRTALFPSLVYRPDSDTEVSLRVRSLDNTMLDFSGLPTTGTLDTTQFATPRNRILTAEGLPDSTNKSQGFNLQWNQKLDNALALSLLLAHNQTELDQRGVYSLGCGAAVDAMGLGVGTPDNQCLVGGVRLWDKFDTWTLSPSLSGTLEGDGIKQVIMAGVDYEKTKDDAYMAVSDPFGMGAMYMGLLSMSTVDLINPAYPAWSDPVAPSTPDQQNRYDSTAVYVQDQVTINGKLHLLGSLRHSRIKVKDAGNNPALGFTQNNDTSNSKTTPRIGATYEFTPSVSVFAGYGEGIKVPTGSTFVSPPKPEESKQTEVGLRLKEWNEVTATLAWFDLVRRNVAVSAGMGLSRQAGEHRSTGVDLDLVWQASEDLRWLAAWSSQNARITEDTSIPVGSKLFNIPQNTLRLAARYDAHGGSMQGLGLGLGVAQRSQLAGNNNNTFYTPAVTLWDAQVSYAVSKTAKLGLNIANLMDKKYFVPINYFSGGVIPAQRRTVTATVSVMF